MGVVTCDEMRALEQAAFAAGATAEGLMDEAGAAIGRMIATWFPRPGTAVACIGKGHNGGDALVALAVLARRGWQVGVCCPFPEADLAALPRRKLAALAAGPPSPHPDPRGPRPWVLLDGLLGIGARGPLREPLAAVAAALAALRRDRGAQVVAVDIPSGLDADTGVAHPGAVCADLTLAVGVPKRGLLDPAAAAHVGRLGLVPLAALPPPAGGALRLITPHTLALRPEPRPFATHTGGAGRIGVVAGGPGTTGAAVLCAHAALRAGGGLVTLFAPVPACARIAAAAPPELMVRPFTGPAEVLAAGFDTLAVGPGLGPVPNPETLELLERATQPVVLDADGLNQLAAAGRQDLLAPRVVATPHPGEFRRLAPDLAGLAPLAAARAFAGRHPATLVLKGARSVVAGGGGPLWVNPTGTPGMATAGQGDVLTGVIAALVAGGAGPVAAAALGCWLCGRAAERALRDGGQSECSLTAGDTLAWLGGAFTDWREQAG